ncbi:hypothetical protein KIN20_015437 [Parelaphostrongylus tenuis]|uniref:Cyclin G associated kinase n=1 Tax=Parelaphostrongylus tenuis TaxID=148309 RepID=A0AAD5QSG6_PARTN|nr:hypothetical protein KIN20_015437 [Parelaphostrongylus tenuis]
MAVCHMHERKTPITHRDIKIENLLFNADGQLKLCDFGSATTQIFTPNETWSAARRVQLEEEMQRHTTPMYRAPEILDTYQNFVVGPQQDIWALGCVLYYLCYHVHPFEDSSKLRILNVAYSIPSGFDEFADVVPIIESCLKVDPVSRPVARDLVERTEALAIALNVDLKEPFSVDGGLGRPSGQKQAAGSSSNGPPPRPPPPRTSVITEDVTEQASAMLGAIKGQGLSLLKNLKDKSTAVVQKVQSRLVSQEVAWITSRLCIVPQGRNAHEQSDEEEWNARVMSTGRPYVVFNMTSKQLHAKYSFEPITCKLSSVYRRVPPPVESILLVCSSVATFLRGRPLAAAVLFGSEGQCIVVAAAIMLYCKLISDAHDAWDFVANRRRTVQRFSPSHIRMLDLVKYLTSSSSGVSMPGSRTTVLHSVSFSDIPIFGGLRSGLRPVIEIYQGESLMWNSVRSRSSFMVTRSFFELDIEDLELNGQITLLMFYCKSDLSDEASKKLLFFLVFHTSLAGAVVNFGRSELDINQAEDCNIPTNFRIALGLRVLSNDDGGKVSSPKISSILRPGSPSLLVINSEEEKQIMDWYGVSTEPIVTVENDRHGLSSDDHHRKSDLKSDFFETLDWSQAQQEDSTPSKSTQSAHERSKPEKHSNSSSNFGLMTTRSVQPTVSSDTSRENGRRSQHPRTGVDAAEGRQAGIHIERVVDPYSDHCHYDSDKETPILTASTPPQALVKEFDLLGLGTSEPAPKTEHDPLSDFLKDTCLRSSIPTVHTDNLLDELCDSSRMVSPEKTPFMHRNVSAPVFQPDATVTFDPFAEFLSQSTSNPPSTQASAPSSCSTTPKPARPNYSRSAFESLNTNASVKTKVPGDAFGDLLSSQGFTASSRNVNRTLGDLRKAEEVKDMDPVTIRIKNWVDGKERNIRALLGSLNDVLWEGAEMWKQPRMADLLSPSQVKRSYYKACLLVHPDKQVGTPHEKLARAIFTELNDAWNAFEQAGGLL